MNFRRWATLLLFAGLIVAGSFCFLHWRGGPSSTELRSTFVANERDLDALAKMMIEDAGSGLKRVTSSEYPNAFSWPRNLSEMRWLEYQRLLRKLEMKDGVRISDDGAFLSFYKWTRGMSLNSEMKGYMYLIGRPYPIMQSVDAFPDNSHRIDGKIYIIPLKGKWYMFEMSL